MNPRLEWLVGPEGDDDVLAATRPEAVLPRRAGRRLALTPVSVGLYVAALVCAGWIGFGLGRWSESHAAVRSELERQVAVETVAWRESDTGLLVTTLDPEAPPDWRSEQMAQLERMGPTDYGAEVTSVEMLEPDRARVDVLVTTPNGQRSEARLYRAVDQTWYRTPER